jgi:hypothetical protein
VTQTSSSVILRRIARFVQEESRVRWWIWVLLAIILSPCLWFAALLTIVPAVKQQWTRPSEKQLTESFQQHRAALERLAEMARQDSLGFFCLEGSNVNRPQSLVSDARFAEYKRLMEASGVVCVANRSEGFVDLRVWSNGFPGTHAAIGFGRGAVPVKAVSCLDARKCGPPSEDPKWGRLRVVHLPQAQDWWMYAW